MLRIAILGCGARGRTYASMIGQLKERYQIMATCDLVESRAREAASHATEEIPVFTNDEAFFQQGKVADLLIIATQDRNHYGHALRAMELGYDILLEKPAAQTLEQCEHLDQVAKEKGRKIGLCFVLRYTPFYRAVRDFLDSGRLGKVISMHASEGVEPYHQAHSFVRGHWAKTGDCTPMILAKCSHDTDLLCWFAGSEIKHVSSYGRLEFFNKKNAPQGAPMRCSDGCEHRSTCMYDAHHYLGEKRRWLRMVMDGSETATDEQIMNFIQTSPWGRCVFHCDNDAVDHQVISGEMKNGVSVTFSMTAFDLGRSIEIYGTKGSLKGGLPWQVAGAHELWFRDHSTGEKEDVPVIHADEIGYAGHGGGDFGIIDSLDKLFGDSGILSPGLDGLAGHQFALLAERDRLSRV